MTVLQNDGSVLASSITCAGMALIDASIHVFDVIIGSSMVRMIKKVIKWYSVHDLTLTGFILIFAQLNLELTISETSWKHALDRSHLTRGRK